MDGSAQIVKKYIDPKKPIDLADTSNKFVAQIRAMFGIVIAKDGSQTIDNLGAFESRLNIKNAYYVPPPKTASWRAFVKIKLNERAMQIKRRFASSRVKKNIYYDESVVELFALNADVTYSFRTFQRELDALVGVESLVNTGEAIENENLIIVHSDGKLKIFPFPGNLAVPESSIIRGFVPNEETFLKWVDAPSFDLPGSKYTPEEILPRTARAQQYYWENVVSMLYNGSAPKQLDLATKDTQDAFDGIFKNWEFFDAATDSEGARKAYLELIEFNKALIHITRYTYDMIYGGSISDLPTRKKNKEEIYNLLNGLLNSARKELRAADGESIAETIQHGFPDDYAAHPVIAILIKNKGDLDKTFADLQSYLKVNIFDNNKFKDLAKKYGDLLQNQVELKDLLILKNQEIRIAKSKYSEDSEVLKKLLNEKADLESDLAKLSQKLGGGYFADDLIKAGNESSFPNKNVFKHLKDRRRGIFYIENIQILRDLNAVKDDFLHRLYRRIRNICARGR